MVGGIGSNLSATRLGREAGRRRSKYSESRRHLKGESVDGPQAARAAQARKFERNALKIFAETAKRIGEGAMNRVIDIEEIAAFCGMSKSVARACQLLDPASQPSWRQ
jgi:hypothetical protein